MATTELEIWNLSLRAANSRGQVADQNEQSREAEECRAWYSLARDTMLEGGYWPVIKTAANPALIVDNSQSGAVGASIYSYTFRLPANCLRPWYLSSYASFELLFRAASSEIVLLTNDPEPLLVYGAQQVLVALWTPSMQSALIHGLAGLMAPSLTGKSSIVERNYQLANRYMSDAAYIGANVEMTEDEYILEKFLARGGGAGRMATQFIYPIGLGFGGGAL